MSVFLFTDIESSTQLWEQHPHVMHAVLIRHNAIIKDSIEKHGGHLVRYTGDGGFYISFPIS